ncbi:helix-turn-helix domain-containing protein [Lusitaniella coriacea LEGE 07157]|uniref:Helix-turn-helix domain-containing protein n=1 Tax=Lusitaniella coriacea LEGE 07157 TaxID=945747 RepID=A0A8J7E1L8_9CYAN|nr:helix-turn-helix domain-containing protein [Lusitaniella coriacea]MBE9118593.1 helix-turn-helix domain-containing protein [Lusitaniella coriacea LEGE 07157]
MELTQTSLSPLVKRAEAQLLESEAYQSAIAQLQNLTDDAVETVRGLVTAVAQEAMHLVCQQMSASSQTPVAKPSQSHSSTEKSPIDSNPTPGESDRQVQFCRIGQTLREKRLSRSISVRQLNATTLVPIYQIQAIEAGEIEKLPENIYLQGFIRQLGNALGLDGVALAASLPQPETSVIPSWYRQPPTATMLQFKPVHLYLGYTALMAGAIGGMSWMSGHHARTVSVEPQDATPQRLVASETDRAIEVQKQTSPATAGIAPPETMNP